MKKWLWLVALLAIAIGLGLWAWHRHDRAAATNPAARQTAKVTREDITATVDSTGSVQANQNVEIKCKASGEIVRLPFDISDHVKKGDLLVELDPIDEKRDVKLAKAALTASQARLNIAEQNLAIAKADLQTARLRAKANLASAQAAAKDAKEKAGRMKQLLEKKLASQENYETAQTTAEQAQAQLQQAKAQVDDLQSQKMGLEVKQQNIDLAKTDVEQNQIALENAQQRLDDTRVVAPMNGVVATRDVQTGQIISSGITNVGGGTTILTLADLSRIFIEASVDESQIGRVAVGQKVNITADAFPGTRFTGKVVRIATQGQNVSNVVTFDVKIEVTSDNKSKLKPQMTANVSIVISHAQNVLTVPTAAVYRHRGKPTVTVVAADGKTHSQTIVTGITDYKRYQIKNGLKLGQRVELQSLASSQSNWRASRNRRPHHGPF